MSRGVELPWHVFGRRIRPFSFGLMLATFVVAIQFITVPSSPGDDLHHGIMATLGFFGGGLLFAGWATKKDSPHDWGLLLLSGFWMGRSVLWALEGDYERTGLYMGFIFAIMSIGAWFIERYDHRWQHIIAERHAGRRATDAR